MEDEIKKLKNEIKNLKEKLKKKNEKLKKTNRQLIQQKKIVSLWVTKNHARWNERAILEQLTSHIEINIYDIDYEYDGKKYHEPKVPSQGSKWLSRNLIICLAERHELEIEYFQIKIINAQKLW